MMVARTLLLVCVTLLASCSLCWAFMPPAPKVVVRSGGRLYARNEVQDRRGFVQRALAGAAAAAFLGRPRPAEALFFSDEVTDTLDTIVTDRSKVEEVIVALKKKDLRGTPDDSAVIVRYIGSVFQPLQETMAKLSPKLKLEDEEKQKRAELVPLLLKGHLLELKAAAKANNAADQLEEMEEVAESVDEFLALAALKYKVRKEFQPSEWDVVKDYGVFACEYWGKERLPGSNLCVDPPSKQ